MAPCTGLASKISEQGNTLTVRRVPGHRGVTRNEIADIYAKEAVRERTPEEEREREWGSGASP